MKKTEKKKLLPVIGWRANEEEQHMLEVLRKEMVRSSNSDVIRVLVRTQYEKILQTKNTAVL